MRIETTRNNYIQNVWGLDGSGVKIDRVPAQGVRVLAPGSETPVEIAEGQVWKHSSSGRLYHVVGIGVIEDGTLLSVHYRSGEDGTIWARSVEAWLEPVSVTVSVPRFCRDDT